MSNKGRLALAALESVRTFHQEISQLIGTADHWLGGRCGWEPNSNTVLRDGSYRWDQPAGWMPEAVDRWYKTRDGHIAAFLAVLLHPRNPYPVPFDEPLVTVGWARTVAPAAYKNPPRWYAYAAFWNDFDRDGSFHPLPRKLVPGSTGDQHGVATLHAAAMPLYDLTSSEVLVERMLGPLVGAVPPSARERPPGG